MLAALSVATLIGLAAADAAPSHPTLTGRIEVDPSSGILAGDLCVRGGLPTRSFLLNRGLNIRSVSDPVSGEMLNYSGSFNAQGRGDATRYTLAEGAGTNGFCVRYVGAFPVYRVDEGERAAADWKGLIAFDGRTVRATEQTRFYPTPLVVETGEELDQQAYDVEVSCHGCRAIYWNGSAPAQGPLARFVSDTPRPLLLYAGDFPYREAGATLVGAGSSDEAVAVIRSGLRAIAAAHEAYLGVPMTDEPVMLSFAAVSRDRQLGRSSWGFATWPTIAGDGRVDFDHLTEGSVDGRLAPGRERFLAHEMGHHYFGARYAPMGPIRWFLLESTAEYLASRAVRSLQGPDAYAALMQGYVQQVPADALPLDEVVEVGQIGVSYRYSLGPILLTAMEHQLGEAVLQEALSSLVKEPPARAMTYADFRAILIESGATEADLAEFEAACLAPGLSAACRPMAGVGPSVRQ